MNGQKTFGWIQLKKLYYKMCKESLFNVCIVTNIKLYVHAELFLLAGSYFKKVHESNL